MRFNSMPLITRQTAPSGQTDVRRFYHLSAMGKKKKKTRLTEHQQHKLEDAQRRKIYLKRLVDMLKEYHETLAMFGYYVIALHALAALAHHYFFKDNTLLRMMPKKRV